MKEEKEKNEKRRKRKGGEKKRVGMKKQKSTFCNIRKKE